MSAARPFSLLGNQATRAPERPLSIVEQVRRASHVRHRLAMACGAILGAFIPVAVYVIAHLETQARPQMWVLVAAGLVFSGTTVYGFGRSAFGHPAKAAGFVVLMEGVLVFSVTAPLTLAALALLALINAVSTGTSLALEHQSYARAADRDDA